MGSLIFAVGLQIFSLPSELLLGGATGIATVVYHLWGLPVGTTVLLVNLPLFVLCWKEMGRRALIRNAYATLLFSAMLDIAGALNYFTYRGDRLLCALFGGLFMGVGLSIVFSRDYVTGGTDLAAQFLARKLPVLSFGKWILVLDSIVVITGAAVFRSVEVGMYSALMIFIYSQVVENYLSGKSRAKVALIWSNDPARTQATIYRVLARGVTLLEATGGHTGKRRELLLCAVSDREAATLRAKLKDVDPDAFIIVLRATEIWGEGFLKL